MKFRTPLAALALVIGASVAHAAPSDDAHGLVDTAIAEIKAKGLDTAVKDFNANAGGKWHQNGLYVVVVRFDGQMLAHSANGKFVGKNMLEAKDAAGKPFVQENIAAVKSSGTSQVELRWANPDTKKIQDAVMVSKRVADSDVYVGSIAFK